MHSQALRRHERANEPFRSLGRVVDSCCDEFRVFRDDPVHAAAAFYHRPHEPVFGYANAWPVEADHDRGGRGNWRGGSLGNFASRPAAIAEPRLLHGVRPLRGGLSGLRLRQTAFAQRRGAGHEGVDGGHGARPGTGDARGSDPGRDGLVVHLLQCLRDRLPGASRSAWPVVRSPPGSRRRGCSGRLRRQLHAPDADQGQPVGLPADRALGLGRRSRRAVGQRQSRLRGAVVGWLCRVVRSPCANGHPRHR